MNTTLSIIIANIVVIILILASNIMKQKQIKTALPYLWAIAVVMISFLSIELFWKIGKLNEKILAITTSVVIWIIFLLNKKIHIKKNGIGPFFNIIYMGALSGALLYYNYATFWFIIASISFLLLIKIGNTLGVFDED